MDSIGCFERSGLGSIPSRGIIMENDIEDVIRFMKETGLTKAQSVALLSQYFVGSGKAKALVDSSHAWFVSAEVEEDWERIAGLIRKVR